MSEPWVPTVDDLRVKMCYICREEERYDVPTQAKTKWTHPCQCTLIAHESCLLHWIQSSQENQTRAEKAYKCPQCGADYEIESDNPLLLRILNKLNQVLTRTGKITTLVGIGTTVFAFGTCIYLLCTSYGAWAVREFLGQEMFDLILTEDPTNWPWHAYLNLPLIPFSLILARSSLWKSAVSPMVPLFLAWPTTLPIRDKRLDPQMWLGIQRKVSSVHPLPSLLSWPPAPIVATVFFPLVQNLYRNLFARFHCWVLNSEPSSEPPPPIFPWRLEIRFGQDAGDAANGEAREGENRADEQQNGDGNQDPVAAAERLQSLSSASAGRYIGGALLVPRISSLMGSLLLRLSKRSDLLRKFLATRPPLKDRLDGFSIGEVGSFSDVGQAVKTAVKVMIGGTRTWTEADPVWWRNSVGLGVFIVVKDCVSLLHLYLTKREIQTRRVKNKSFKGIDVRELDLIVPPPMTLV
ncbi:hypothetical protein BJ322DRAFT_1124980 [Thelephora terrestris]|uniref:RING-CH-type domain-containing protein n=1 Tax=Thelephora terrestris TaxID=56493 RepID=A0A9P6L6E1_9AGAM|nr:hypothetical protein BJ322DRAFT_1124980 [Thelephora terrestris]